LSVSHFDGLEVRRTCSSFSFEGYPMSKLFVRDKNSGRAIFSLILRVLMVFGFLLILTIAYVKYLASTSITNQPTATVNRSFATIESRLKPVQTTDLKSLQTRAIQGIEKAQTTVVAVGHTGLSSAASGVIISADGLVLSQWHVTHAVRVPNPKTEHWEAGEKTSVVLADGRKVRAELLGAATSHDLSLLRILDQGPFPFAELKADIKLEVGDWILKLGHPGHYRPGRPAMVRLGRILVSSEKGFVSDCLINGGDSGGPFFDLDGRLAGLVLGVTADLANLRPHNADQNRDVNTFLFAANSNSAIDRQLKIMKQGKVEKGSARNYDNELLMRPRLAASDWMDGVTTLEACSPIASGSRASVVAICVENAPVVLATVIALLDQDAYLVTKASELPTNANCRLPSGALVEVKVIQTDRDHDLAILRVPVTELVPVRLAKEPNPVCGTLAIAVGPEGPLAFGVVSIPRLENMDPLIEEPEDKEQQPGQPTHTRLPGMIGRFELGAGFHVDQLFEKSAFEAGLRQGDVLRSIDGKEIMGDQDFYSQTFSQHALVRLQVVREGKPLDLTIPFVSRRDLGYNVRSSDFPVTFEIAAAVSANDCGAPVLNLQGECLGITIARYDQQGCKVIPADIVERFVASAIESHLKPVQTTDLGSAEGVETIIARVD